MTGTIVRKMETKDIEQAVEIHRKVLREGLTDIGFAVEEFFSSSIISSPNTCLVAEKNGEVMGFIIGDVKEWSFGLERSGWVELVEVDPGHMGEGIGKALARGLMGHFEEEGINDVFTTIKWDTGDLIAFFKSIGFDKSQFINLRLINEEEGGI